MEEITLAYEVARLYRQSNQTMPEMARTLANEGADYEVCLQMIHAIDAYVDEE